MGANDFDPGQKAETWLFEKIGTDQYNRPMYRRLWFNKVSYDGSPDCVMEPVVGAGEHSDGTNSVVIKPGVTAGYCVGFEVVNGYDETGRPSAFAFGQNVGI